MPKPQPLSLFVVDGSNIATEGRSDPSLEQLNDAVLAFMEENPKVEITVVVDATFGHRISKKEVRAFDEAVANNELVTPPAGAIGRGDAFVLSIANKAKAGVLSNDSFQEFHGDYDWLFDEGRLIGGKPVPHVGWVFVSRTPVRGPKSRRAVKEAKDADRTEAKQAANRRVRKRAPESDDGASSDDTSRATSESRQQDPSSSDSRAVGGRRRGGRRKNATEPTDTQVESTETAAAAPKDHVNDLMPFLDFVERHPVGTSVTAEVESYASHGAYARTGDVLIYLPLRLLDDPAPRSARSVLTVGDTITVVIVGFTPDRRSIDAALPHMATGDVEIIEPAPEPEPASEKPVRKRAAKRTAAKKSTAKKSTAKKSTAKKTTAKKSTATKTTAKKSTATKTTAKKSTAKKSPPRKAASRSSAKSSMAEPAAATSSGVEQAVVEQASGRKPSAKQSVAKQTATRKSAATKTAAKKASASTSTAKQASAKKTAVKASTAKQTSTKKAPAKKASASPPASKKSAAKKSTTRKAPAKKAAAKSPVDRDVGGGER